MILILFGSDSAFKILMNSFNELYLNSIQAEDYTGNLT
jgi:hypothetical protein